MRAPRHLLAVAALAATLAGPATTGAAPRHPGLPRLASTALPAPEPAQSTELDKALAEIVAGKLEAGQARLKDGGAALLPAMARRLAELRKSLARDAAAAIIEEARKGRTKSDDKHKKHDKRDKAEREKERQAAAYQNDWLALVMAKPRPTEQAFKDTVAVLAIGRALVELGTTPAAREVVNIYFYFGDLFRIDAQQLVQRLGDRAVPALTEARKHDVEKVRRWAARALDTLGRAIPGEAVQIADPEIVADVIRAYGRAKELDALRVIVSFTGSDRASIRDAAREAVSSFGDAALWQLREAYEATIGKRPPPGSTWDKIALELFESQDRARLEEIVSTFDEGVAALKEKKLDVATKSFDVVLARFPGFDRRGEMVPAYAELARELADKERPRAIVLARKASRLELDGPLARPMESLALTLEGEALAESGVVDLAILQRALALDPQNTRARAVISRLESNPAALQSPRGRYLGAGAIGVAALVVCLVLALGGRRGGPRARPPEPSSPEGPEPDAS